MTNNNSGRDYLSLVLDKLQKRISEIDQTLAEGEKEIESMHEYYWENYTEMDQYGYENYDNQQALLHQVNANQEQRIRRHRYRKMLDSPYFGRVDFRFDGDDDPETFYIGIGNFSERTGSIPLVYDWRAPVSGLFYDYDKGPASYEAPGGEMTGEVTTKWQYKIRQGKMIYEFESDMKIDDEILGAELGGKSAVKLKNIIRTIQKEQNAIIRNTKDRIMVIQGAAGSGKTSIALHRIAYLLYHDRANLKSSNILILSPNSVFADYISQILPELGEENIREMSFDLFAYHQLKDTADDCEDRYDHLERLMKKPDERDIFNRKQSREFINQLEGYFVELEDDLMNFRDITYKGFTMTEKEFIELFYFKFTEIPLLSRMESVAEYFIDQVETLRNADLIEEERELLMEKFMSMYETRDLYVLYSRFLKREGYRPLKAVPLEKRKLKYEDVYPLLYMKYTLLKQKEHNGIKHLVVDEMQDYSRLQYLILRKMFPCRMTILGDKAQTMDEETQDVLTFLPKIFGKNIRTIVMNKSYRNTVEIAEYANALTGITDIDLFDRHGAPVREEKTTSLNEALDLMLKEQKIRTGEYETTAVLLATEAEARAASLYLKEKLEAEGFDTKQKLTYLDRNSSSFRKGIIVTTYYLAKGLEFDQVFGIFSKKVKGPLMQQAKYITATRALHELYMLEY
ncbi:MAG: AAA family ATPase [Clostridiales bacterium]|nr:AAA family ATPase [Candidatus Blautia equi]